MQVMFRRAAGGFQKGEQVELAIHSGVLMGRRSDGSMHKLDVKRYAKSVDVGVRKDLVLGAGEQLLLQANHEKQWLNGERVTVAKCVEGRIHLTDGRVIPRNYRTFTYGYAVTSHAAQGKTVDDVFVSAPSRSMGAMGSEQFYVSISRGREQCRVFTDDPELLRQRVGRSRERIAAMEAVPRGRWLERIHIGLWYRWHQVMRRFNPTQKQSTLQPTQKTHDTYPKRKYQLGRSPGATRVRV